MENTFLSEVNASQNPFAKAFMKKAKKRKAGDFRSRKRRKLVEQFEALNINDDRYVF